MPRWQPVPHRVEVDEATERLRALEAQILFGRTSARRALRTWAYGDDERPMVAGHSPLTTHHSPLATYHLPLAAYRLQLTTHR